MSSEESSGERTVLSVRGGERLTEEMESESPESESDSDKEWDEVAKFVGENTKVLYIELGVWEGYSIEYFSKLFFGRSQKLKANTKVNQYYKTIHVTQRIRKS